MNRWLFKTEPADYSYQELARAGRGVWNGVRNPRALAYLRLALPGDDVFIYHTGKERAIVGLAEIASTPYPDREGQDPRLIVVDVMPREPLPRPVTLAEIKSDPGFAGWELVRLPRLSVMPVPEQYWHAVLALAADHAEQG